MKLASSDARKATAAAISSARPIRPIGWPATSMSRKPCGSGAIAMARRKTGVSTVPGQTQLTRTPRRAYSTASCRVISTTAPLLGAYGAWPGMPTSPEMEPLMTTDPPAGRWASICRTASRQQRKTPRALTPITKSQSSSVVAVSSPL